MIEELATVAEVQSDGSIWLETQRGSTCSQCAVNSGCGTAVLSKILGKRSTRIQALSSIPVQVGDRVIVGLQDEALVRGSLAVYAVPILAMTFSALLGEYLAQSLLIEQTDLTASVFGLSGLAGGFWWLTRFTSAIKSDLRYQPQVLRLDPSSNPVMFINPTAHP